MSTDDIVGRIGVNAKRSELIGRLRARSWESPKQERRALARETADFLAYEQFLLGGGQTIEDVLNRARDAEARTDGNRLEQPTELSVEKTVAPKSRTTLRREAAQRGEEPPQFDGADTVRDDEADGIEAVRRYRRERADQHFEGLNANEEEKQ